MALETPSLDNISAPARHCICIVLILLLTGMWYLFKQKPRNEDLAAVNAQNMELQTKLQQAQTVRARYDQYQKDLMEIDARLTTLQSFLPTEKEAAAFLRSVQEKATSSNLKVNLFRPSALVSRGFFFDWPVEVRLEGNYHGLGRFFESISQAQRIVDVPTITISNIGNQTNPNWTLTATGTVTTYVQGK